MKDMNVTAPEFGQDLPLAGASAEVFGRLALRRSSSALTLTAPGPSESEIEDLMTLAARVPDHGKLFPWRFIVIEGEAKDTFARKLEAIAARRPDAPKATAALGKLTTPPLCIAVVSRVTDGKIPEWEQQLSSGAACMTLLLAADAAGYGANWITDWYAYDEEARALLSLQPGERIAGYVHIGTPTEAPKERVRPDLTTIVSRL
jgi:nitroreductase